MTEDERAEYNRTIQETDQLRWEIQNLRRNILNLFQDLDCKLVKQRQEALTKLNQT